MSLRLLFSPSQSFLRFVDGKLTYSFLSFCPISLHDLSRPHIDLQTESKFCDCSIDHFADLLSQEFNKPDSTCSVPIVYNTCSFPSSASHTSSELALLTCHRSTIRSMLPPHDSFQTRIGTSSRHFEQLLFRCQTSSRSLRRI